jgi:type IV pilus assembly protein PilB
MSTVKKGLGELLVRESLVNVTQLEEARKEQKNTGGRLASALVKLGYLDDKAMSEFLGKQYGFPDINLDDFEIDQEAIKSIPPEICHKHHVIPVSRRIRKRRKRA